MVDVTQADRDRADTWDLEWYGDLDKKQIEELSKAFARHRIEAMLEAARIALSMKTGCEADYKCEAIAKAIRNAAKEVSK